MRVWVVALDFMIMFVLIPSIFNVLIKRAMGPRSTWSDVYLIGLQKDAPAAARRIWQIQLIYLCVAVSSQALWVRLLRSG